jgi:hypothetical protein
MKYNVIHKIEVRKLCCKTASTSEISVDEYDDNSL